ncbi:MAG TPA: hypothetical protein VHL57_12425 [Flavobacteriales bacterium]|jgi:hypothetical protein|nr:hypothetical protein [Flavobacteriales bacterium]
MTLLRLVRPLREEERQLLEKGARQWRLAYERKFPWLISTCCLSLIVAGALDLFHFNKGKEHAWAIVCICFVPIAVWVAIEAYVKDRRQAKRMLQVIGSHEREGHIEVFRIEAKRVARMREHEDEGDLYLFELTNAKTMFLWDGQDHGIDSERFPVERFEVYVNEEMKGILESKVLQLGEKLVPMEIRPAMKWRFLKHQGVMPELEQLDTPFDTWVERITSFGSVTTE